MDLKIILTHTQKKIYLICSPEVERSDSKLFLEEQILVIFYENNLNVIYYLKKNCQKICKDNNFEIKNENILF